MTNQGELVMQKAGTATREAEVVDAGTVIDERAMIRYDPSQLLSQAIEKGLDITTLERLMSLQERWEANRAKAEFFEALARFQSLVPDIPKQKQGYGYLYAPLGDIDRVIKDAMRDCGLSKKWVQAETGDTVTVSCVITHIAGHSESSSIGPVGWDLLEKTKQMNGLQHRAAVITYLQRYTLVAALGLATADDDTDGRAKTKAEIVLISDRQVADLSALIDEVKADKSKFLKWAQVETLEEIRATEYKKCVASLEAKRTFAGKQK